MDDRFMRRALELAALGRYTASPNPAVGAVLAGGVRVLAEGFHARAGGPHAEAQVLRVGAVARGATLFVNLEPCCHVGRTPPCVERIIASGVQRVVAAHPEPDPRVGEAVSPGSAPPASRSRPGCCSRNRWTSIRRFSNTSERETRGSR